MAIERERNYPVIEEGAEITSKIDELMLKYYRVNDGTEKGALHFEAFQVGQKLQFYFMTYSVMVVNETTPNAKMKLSSLEHGMKGMEAPLTLMLDNEFFRNNYQVIISGMLNEITRMSTSRKLGSEDATISYALSICKWEYLSSIAGLVAGSEAQKAMDYEMRKFTSVQMEDAMAAMRDSKKPK